MADITRAVSYAHPTTGAYNETVATLEAGALKIFL